MWIGANCRQFKKGIAKLTPIRTPCKVYWPTGLNCGVIWLSGLLHGKDQAHQLLGCVRKGDIVMLALGSLLSKISSKDRIPKADIFRGVVEGVAQISGSSLLHVGVGTR